MKFKLISILLLFSGYSFGQIVTTKIDTLKLPKEVRYSGKINNAVFWTDSLGKNYVLLTETEEYTTKNQDGDDLKNAALYAFHYVRKNDSTKLLWKVYDYSKDCPFDVFVKFIGKAFKVTDLDKNGVAEVWLMYENQCTSDVSPAPTKIIMYEGTKKYAVRGENIIQISKDSYGDGKYTLDESFKKGNPLFKQFAINLWEKNKVKKL
jgi:hypothetical protein